jgi:predicted nucleotidyltransferase
VGSPDGVRRVLARLVVQGVVLAEEHAHATLYRLNRDHVATKSIIELTRLREEILNRIQRTVDAWDIQPIHASLYGSFARGEADEASDLDFLLVVDTATASDDQWLRQIDELARLVQQWTGNVAHLVDTTPETLALMLRDDDPLIGSWRAQAIHLAGMQLMDLLRRVMAEAGLKPKGWR